MLILLDLSYMCRFITIYTATKQDGDYFYSKNIIFTSKFYFMHKTDCIVMSHLKITWPFTHL